MKIIKKLTPTAKYMLLSLVVLFVAFALLGTLVITLVYPVEPLSNYLLGLLFGCIVTALRTIMMDHAIEKEVDMAESKAKNYHQLMFFLRYALLIAFAVILVVFNKVFGVYGGVLGILSMQLSAYGANILLTRHEKKEKLNKGK